MMCRNFFVIIIATLLIFPSNLALAGSIPEYYAEMWVENGPLVTKMYVEPDKMRVEFHKGRDKPTVTLYRMDQDKWYVLHDDKKMESVDKIIYNWHNVHITEGGEPYANMQEMRFG